MRNISIEMSFEKKFRRNSNFYEGLEFPLKNDRFCVTVIQVRYLGFLQRWPCNISKASVGDARESCTALTTCNRCKRVSAILFTLKEKMPANIITRYRMVIRKQRS